MWSWLRSRTRRPRKSAPASSTSPSMSLRFRQLLAIFFCFSFLLLLNYWICCVLICRIRLCIYKFRNGCGELWKRCGLMVCLSSVISVLTSFSLCADSWSSPFDSFVYLVTDMRIFGIIIVWLIVCLTIALLISILSTNCWCSWLVCAFLLLVLIVGLDVSESKPDRIHVWSNWVQIDDDDVSVCVFFFSFFHFCFGFNCIVRSFEINAYGTFWKHNYQIVSHWCLARRSTSDLLEHRLLMFSIWKWNVGFYFPFR